MGDRLDFADFHFFYTWSNTKKLYEDDTEQEYYSLKIILNEGQYTIVDETGTPGTVTFKPEPEPEPEPAAGDTAVPPIVPPTPTFERDCLKVTISNYDASYEYSITPEPAIPLANGFFYGAWDKTYTVTAEQDGLSSESQIVIPPPDGTSCGDPYIRSANGKILSLIHI